MNGLLNANPHANKLQLFSVKLGLSQLSKELRLIFSLLKTHNPVNFNHIRMVSFGATHGCQICHKHPIIIRLGTVIPYVKTI